MTLFNPYVLLGIVLALLGSFGAGYYSGEQDEYERQQVEIARLNEQASPRDTAEIIITEPVSIRVLAP